ncbi:MAG TPA: hypothetical protein VFY71_18695 [Planctomycetota bacterium]|nr:hypothetical protein [Planctomycetota bacterium]
MLAGLDDFSESFARALFEALPEARKAASVEEGHLHVELNSGPSRTDSTIHVYTTEDDEVIVDFGYYGDHFDWPPAGPATLDDPIAFIRALMADEILVAERMRGRSCLGSALVASGLKGFEPPRTPDEIVFLRSWSGHKDRTVRHG